MFSSFVASDIMRKTMIQMQFCEYQDIHNIRLDASPFDPIKRPRDTVTVETRNGKTCMYHASFSAYE